MPDAKFKLLQDKGIEVFNANKYFSDCAVLAIRESENKAILLSEISWYRMNLESALQQIKELEFNLEEL